MNNNVVVTRLEANLGAAGLSSQPLGLASIWQPRIFNPTIVSGR
jgi:hypothetical protein